MTLADVLQRFGVLLKCREIAQLIVEFNDFFISVYFSLEVVVEAVLNYFFCKMLWVIIVGHDLLDTILFGVDDFPCRAVFNCPVDKGFHY